MIALYGVLLICVCLTLVLVLAPLFRTPELQQAQKQRFAGLLALVFLIGGFGLYHLFGSPRIIPVIEQRAQKMEELRQSILEHSKLVKEDSSDVAAWVQLGQDFIQTGQYGAAANAFKQSVLLTGGNPVLLVAYAKSMVMEADGKVTDDAKKALQMALLQDTQNPDARYFLALRDLQDGKLPEAMAAMKALYHSLPDDSPLKATINRQIGRN